jgi:hypothetical protein
MLVAEIMTMNHVTFTAEIARSSRVTADIDARHDELLWRSAADVLAHREYGTDAGAVLVQTDWRPMQSSDEIVQTVITLTSEPARAHARDLPSVVERYFHDAFLLLNIAVPGVFGGVIATSGGEFRVEELTFDASLFEYAWVSAMRSSTPQAAPLDLGEVRAWYDALGIGTREVAESAIEKVLYHCLHMARSTDEWARRVRLTLCLEALEIANDDLRSVLDTRNAPVLHPAHELDESEVTIATDQAMALVLSRIQADVRRYAASAGNRSVD